MGMSDFTDLGYRTHAEPSPGLGSYSVKGYGLELTVPGDADAATQAALLQRATDRKALYDMLTGAKAYFNGNYADWATMSAQQKDTAARQAQRALGGLIGYVIREEL